MWAGGNGAQRLFHIVDGKVAKAFRTVDSSQALGRLPSGEIIYCGVGTGIQRVDADGREREYLSKIMPSALLNDMVQTRDGSLWIGSKHNGLYRYWHGRLTVFTTANGLPGDVVHTIYEDHEGILWIGTNTGIARWDGHGFVSFDKSGGLSDSEIRAIFEDREGNLWVGAGASVDRFAVTKLKPYTFVQGPAVANVPDHSSVASTQAGGVWCANDLGLWHVTPEGPALVPIPDTEVAGRVQAVAEGADGLVWIVSRSKTDTATFSCMPWRSLAGRHPRMPSVKFGLDDGFFIAAAATRGKLDSICNSKNATVELWEISPTRILSRRKVDTGFVFTMVPDSTGTIWTGCEHGLVTIKDGITKPVVDGMPSGTHVLGIDVDDPADVWVACDHGLGRIRHGKWTLYGLESGLPDLNLYQVLRSGDQIWIGCNSGIFNVSRTDLDAYDRHTIARVPYTLYTAGDGLRSFPNLYTAAKSIDGRLWFAGPKGLTMVDPSRLHDALLPAPVAIETADVDGANVADGHTVTVPPGSGTFNVQFAALTFAAPERVQFRYRLLGFDHSWKTSGGQRSATYTNLPPGHYRFIVQASNTDGVWNGKSTSVAFDLRPHYYQTAWFQGLVIFALLSALMSAFYLRARQIVLRNRELEKKVGERTAELLEANEVLSETKEELRSQNLQLQDTQSELEAQNDELHRTQAVLAEANGRLEALATTDGLTGVKNHRAFRDRLSEEWDRQSRSKAPLSLILLDVDRFKQYNDTYGHPGGDEVLKNVARLLSENARDVDFVARYGGEEFVVVAPSTDPAGAVHLAERLRSAIESAEWPQRAITASFVVATVTPSTASPSDLIAEADAALYRSKEAGRNRVTHTQDAPSLHSEAA